MTTPWAANLKPGDEVVFKRQFESGDFMTFGEVVRTTEHEVLVNIYQQDCIWFWKSTGRYVGHPDAWDAGVILECTPELRARIELTQARRDLGFRWRKTGPAVLTKEQCDQIMAILPPVPGDPT